MKSHNNYLLIYNDYNELFTSDNKKSMDNNITRIIRHNNINGDFKIINLQNASEKSYTTQNEMIGGSVNSDPKNDFAGEWAELQNYLFVNLYENIDEKKVANYYNNLLHYGQAINLNKDKFNELFKQSFGGMVDMIAINKTSLK